MLKNRLELINPNTVITSRPRKQYPLPVLKKCQGWQRVLYTGLFRYFILIAFISFLEPAAVTSPTVSDRRIWSDTVGDVGR